MSEVQNKTEKSESTLIDINIRLGEDGGQPIASAFKIQTFSNQKKVEQLTQTMRLREPVGDDIIIMFKFKVEEGRQKQTIEYFERGLDQQQEDFNISAMQKLFHRPKSAGRVQLFQVLGYVSVVYRIYNEYLQEIKQINNDIKTSKLIPQIKLSMLTKSSTSVNKQKGVSVKPDYIHFSLTSNKIQANDLATLMLNKQALSQQDDSDIITSPFFQLFKNLQQFKLDLKFTSLRRITRFYERILQFGKMQKQRQKQMPLANKGLFRQKANLVLVYSNQFALDGECDYQSEEVFLSLIAKLVKIVQVTNL